MKRKKFNLQSSIQSMIARGKDRYVHPNSPNHLSLNSDVIHGLIDYVDSGIPMGGFMMALVENDLSGTVSKADSNNMQLIPVIIGFVYNECPSRCWGSKKRVDDWIEHRGMSGMEES